MRRSTRLEAATAEKRKTKMSTRILAHNKRLRQEMAQGDAAGEPEEGEEVDMGEDSDFIASSEEEEEEDDDEDEDGEVEAAKPPRRRPSDGSSKRKAIELSTASDSSDQDEILKPVRLKSALKRPNASSVKAELPPPEKKPKSILKRPKPPSAGSSPETKPQSHVDLTAESHKRPMKQRPVTNETTTDAGGRTEPAVPRRKKTKSLLSSIVGSGSSGTVGNTLTQFFNEILQWNFYDALMKQAQKDFATVSQANDGSEEGEVEIARVPSKFTSYEHYFSVWKPLALEEVQAQTLNAVFTDQPSPMPIQAASSGSNFLERTCKIRVETKKQKEHHSQRRHRAQLDSIFVNDLVLIGTKEDYFRAAFRAHSGGGDSKKAVNAENGEVEDEEGRGFLGIVLTQRASREGVTISVLASEWRQYEAKKDELFLFKINNLVTSVREFRALCDCEGYKLMPLLLSGEHRAGSMQLDSLGLGYVRWLRGAFNESQLEAIAAAATSEGFTLIKGPPGTGKTTTLKGLLNSLHLREYSRYYNAVLDVARRPDNETNEAWAKIGNEKPHILVTAPSNAAVDNIVGKIMEQGFCDGEGRKYFPKIVRVGRGMSNQVRSVGLEDMVNQICGQPYDVLQQKWTQLRHQIAQVEFDSIGLRNRFREVVAAIDRDPDGILALEAQQIQLQLQQRQASQQQQQQQQQQPVAPPSPGSPPPPPPVDSPPPPPPSWHLSSPPPVVQLSPTAPSPPPPFSLSPPPPGVSAYPASPPPLYVASPPAIPAPHSPPALYSASTYTSSFTDDQEEDEEDEAFPASYGSSDPVATCAQATTAAYNAEATSKAYNAFFDDDDDEEMHAEEDEPLPNAQLPSPPAEKDSDSQDANDASPAHEEEDEAFPTIQDEAPPPEPVPSDDETEEDEDLPSSSTASKEVVTKNEVDVTKEVTKIEVEVVKKEDTSSPKVEAEIPKEEQEPVERTHVPVKEEPVPVKEEYVEEKEERVHVKEEQVQPIFPESSAPPMSPPPPPPMSPTPPPPPTSPPPPPPDSPGLSSGIDSDEPMTPSSPPPPVARGPIDYGRYLQYRLLAQQLNSCLERLSELRLEQNRYSSALRVVSDTGKPNIQQLRQSLEVSFLDTAHIVFTTLSSAGVTALNDCTKFDILVVDEAAQAVELSSIIPMKFGSRQCVLVGDPQQLSATVFSRTSGASLYERSLFERLETTGHPVHMLRTQYRSHPLISSFPRHYFYDGKLQDGENVQTPAYDRPYHHLGVGAFLPLVFWNLLSSRETTRSVSRLNVDEAEMAVNLYLTLKNSCPPDAVAGKVGIITPYSQQMEELKNRFRHTLGDHFDSEVEINTVDGFQGREKDVIILSTVRADPRAGVGFLNDIRRMNVALTRAKFACYVIGSEKTLRSSKPWSALMDHAYKTNSIVHVQDPNCNLLTLRPMDMPPAGHSHAGGGGRGAGRGGGRGGGRAGRGNRRDDRQGYSHHPPSPIQVMPPQPYPQGGFPNGAMGAMPGPGLRRPAPTAAPGYPHDRRGPSPTNGGRGGRGRGVRDPSRDPRLSGLGGRGASPPSSGRGGGPGAYPGPPPVQLGGGAHPPPAFNQPPPHFQAPQNGGFHPAPAPGLLPPPAMAHGPPQYQQGPPPQQQHQRYPPPGPAPARGPPVPPHFQRHPPPQQTQQYVGPPPPAVFAAPQGNGFPPQQFAPPGMEPPPPFQGGRGGRTRDPRLLRQQGGGRG